MSRVACPSEDTLAAFAGGELTGSAWPRLALHAAECADCGLQLEAADARAETELLNGRYKLLRKLGAGGMGVVCEADDLVLGERVALKLLRPELARDERALEYLKSEVKLSRQIGHAHVCRVFDLGSQANVHYLSMELLRGPSLRSLLAHAALEPQLALKLADQVLCGLQAAHAAGVLHRDLKPDNMLLRYPSPHDPHAVITDFGLARAFRAGQRYVTASRTLVGSAAYLAPEQVEEAPLTEATDVYSFGVVLFELLTGQQPFQGDTPLGIALKRLHAQPPRVSTLRPELAERYDAFVLRCLARDPSERFQSAGDARAALQALCAAPEVFSRRPFRRVGSAFGSICAACAISLWMSPEHDLACTRVLPPAADSQPALLAAAGASPRSEKQPVEPPKGALPSATRRARGAEPVVPPDPPPAAAGRSERRGPRVAAPRANSVTQPVLLRAAGKPSAPASVLTPEGFLDPFAR